MMSEKNKNSPQRKEKNYFHSLFDVRISVLRVGEKKTVKLEYVKILIANQWIFEVIKLFTFGYWIK